MISPLNLERQAAALARAPHHGQETQEPGAAARRTRHAWTIALSREAGTPGATLAREVSERLGYPVYDRELIERIAKEMGLQSNLLDCVDERRKSWMMECVEALTLRGPVSESKFVRRLVEMLMSLGVLGQCVIVGRGAAHVLPIESTLRVRLVGVKQDRIAAAQQRLHLNANQAARWVEATDRERQHFVQDHFYKDPTDPACYDLVLNTSRWSVAECADFIVQAVKQLEATGMKA